MNSAEEVRTGNTPINELAICRPAILLRTVVYTRRKGRVQKRTQARTLALA